MVKIADCASNVKMDRGREWTSFTLDADSHPMPAGIPHLQCPRPAYTKDGSFIEWRAAGWHGKLS